MTSYCDSYEVLKSVKLVGCNQIFKIKGVYIDIIVIFMNRDSDT